MDLKSNVESDAPGRIENKIRIHLNLNTSSENKIFDMLTEHNLISLHFLCEGIENINLASLGDIGIKNKIKSGLRQFLGEYTEEHKYLLAELLYHIKRFDLIRILGSCRHQIEKLIVSYKYINPYWLLLYKVCEVISEHELAKWSRERYQEEFLLRLCAEKKIVQENVNYIIFLLRGLEQEDDQDIRKIVDELCIYQSKFELYPMDKNPCGICLIINMENFSTPALDKRKGTHADVNILSQVFNRFGFRICVKKDKTYNEVFEIIDRFSSEDHTNYNCFILCFLTHGKQNGISTVLYTEDGHEIIMEDIIRKFNGINCPSLLGKPKIFIIQACRGEDEMLPAGSSEFPDFNLTQDQNSLELKSDSQESDAPSNSAAVTCSNLPACEADIIECYATRPGYKSFRHEQQGSWFIKTLCAQLFLCGDQRNFLSITTSVTRLIESASTNKGNKQVPQFNSSLLRDFIFKKWN